MGLPGVVCGRAASCVSIAIAWAYARHSSPLRGYTVLCRQLGPLAGIFIGGVQQFTPPGHSEFIDGAVLVTRA